MQKEKQLLTNFQETLEDYFPNQGEDKLTKDSSTPPPPTVHSSSISTGCGGGGNSNNCKSGDDCCAIFMVVLALMSTCFLGVYIIATDEYVTLLRSGLNQQAKKLTQFVNHNSQHCVEVNIMLQLFEDWKLKFRSRTRPVFYVTLSTFLSIAFTLLSFWVADFTFTTLAYVGLALITWSGCSWIWLTTSTTNRSEKKKLGILHEHLERCCK